MKKHCRYEVEDRTFKIDDERQRTTSQTSVAASTHYVSSDDCLRSLESGLGQIPL